MTTRYDAIIIGTGQAGPVAMARVKDRMQRISGRSAEGVETWLNVFPLLVELYETESRWR